MEHIIVVDITVIVIIIIIIAVTAIVIIVTVIIAFLLVIVQCERLADGIVDVPILRGCTPALPP